MREPGHDRPDLPGGAEDAAPSLPAPPAGAPPLSRTRAVGEAVLCSSYPTQVLAAVVLAAAGLRAQQPDGALNPTVVIALSIVDATLVVALIVLFLRRRGESLGALLLGTRGVWPEASLGLALVVPVTLGVALVVLAVRSAWPSLHDVDVNPMTALVRDPRLAAVFAIVVVFAGGVREEIQRAFQLHRLTPAVVGPGTALVITSLVFGLGHTVQGRDVAVATAALGALWGGLWLRRRSIVAAAVCHALFNLGQVAAGWAAARAGAL
jgi:membrane protease YdiL (CAAX protease family)